MRKVIRKVVVAGMALALVLGTIGCGKTAPAEVKEEEAPIAGGWQAAEDGTITEELQALFDKAMEKMVGVDYTPIELLETQVVAGTNYKFLCESKVVAPDTAVKKAVVTIYEDLQGNAEVLEIEELEDSGEEGLDGGWEAAQDGTITEELQALFDKAMEKVVGVDYTPIELLETQVVAGTNYKFLCESRVVAPDAETKQAIVTIYEDLEGNVSIIDISDTEEQGTGGFGIANPFVEVSSLEEAAGGAGFEMEAPEKVEGFEGKRISYIQGTLIQVVYGAQDNELCIRKGAGEDDISGDYEVYEKEEEMTAGGKTVLTKANADGIYTATWTEEGYAFAVSCDSPMTEELVEALTEQVR